MRTVLVAAILFAGLSQGVKLVAEPKKCDDDCQKHDDPVDPATESLKPVACSLRDKQKADLESAPVLKHQKEIEKIAEDRHDKISKMKKKKCEKSDDKDEEESEECPKKKKEAKSEKKEESKESKKSGSPASYELDNGTAKLLKGDEVEKSLKKAEK